MDWKRGNDRQKTIEVVEHTEYSGYINSDIQPINP